MEKKILVLMIICALQSCFQSTNNHKEKAALQKNQDAFNITVSFEENLGFREVQGKGKEKQDFWIDKLLLSEKRGDNFLIIGKDLYTDKYFLVNYHKDSIVFELIAKNEPKIKIDSTEEESIINVIDTIYSFDTMTLLECEFKFKKTDAILNKNDCKATTIDLNK